MMVASAPHDAPPDCGASQIVCEDPPSSSTRFSLPSAKNPIERESGDQNGKAGESVSVLTVVSLSRRASSESRLRTQRLAGSSRRFATNTSRLPSGDTDGNGAIGALAGANATPSGGESVKRTTSGDGGAGRRYGTASAPTPTSAMAKNVQATHSPRRRLAAADIGAPAWEPPPAIHLNSSRRSLASCQRSSGSLARHFPMTRSSAGGVTATEESASG